MRSTSRGWIKLKSNNPNEHPIIDPNYLSTEIDKWEMRESIKLSREIFAQKAFDDFRDIELEPGEDVNTDEEIDAWVRRNCDTAYHPSCTCRMGDPNDDQTTVVTPEGKVLGECAKKSSISVCTRSALGMSHLIFNRAFLALQELKI